MVVNLHGLCNHKFGSLHGMGAVFERGRSFWQSRQHLGLCHPSSLIPVHQRADWQAQSPLPVTLHVMPC